MISNLPGKFACSSPADDSLFFGCSRGLLIKGHWMRLYSLWCWIKHNHSSGQTSLVTVLYVGSVTRHLSGTCCFFDKDGLRKVRATVKGLNVLLLTLYIKQLTSWTTWNAINLQRFLSISLLQSGYHHN